MIKVVLMDLDDTLIVSQTHVMFPAYLKALGLYCKELGEPEKISGLVMHSYLAALKEYDPSRTLVERFYTHFLRNLKSDRDDLQPFFEQFYIEHYGEMAREYVTPQIGASDLVRWLIDHNYRVVVATNPGLPKAAALSRLELGGLSPGEYPFSMITTLEMMHFGKPQAEYYEEILLRLDVEASEAIMVGDDWENDIEPARVAGLSTYWLTQGEETPPERVAMIDGH